MAIEGVKLGSGILDYIGPDLIEEFAAFVAHSIEKGVNKDHEYYSFLSRICPDLEQESLERVFESCRVEIVNIDLERRHLAERLRQKAIEDIAICSEKFEALRLIIRGAVLEGKDHLSAKKLGISDEQFKLLTAYVDQELARQIEHSRKQLRPKAYEGIGLSGEFNEIGFVIREVFLGSDAHTKGLKKGDVIMEVVQGDKYS